MPRIKTFVFFDTETTGLPKLENNRTQIIELTMVAVLREHILESGKSLNSGNNTSPRPRVTNKLTLCLNPRRMISMEASEINGLTNELLEEQPSFGQEVYNILYNFLNMLPKPLCLVAHNGHGFDFPIIKNHLEKIDKTLPNDILFADSLYGMYDIKEVHNKQTDNTLDVTKHDVDVMQPLNIMQVQNESTPVKNKLHSPVNRGKRRRIFFEGNPKPSSSYKVVDLHTEMVGASNKQVAHRSEDDCLMLLDIAVKMGESFLQWCDENNCALSEIKAMTLGVPI